MEIVLPIEANEISIEKRSMPVPYKYRMMYKLSEISLILYISSGKKASSLLKIQHISAALNSNNDYMNLISFLESAKNETVIKFMPATNRAVNFALAENLLIKQKNGLLKLSKEGFLFAKLLMDNDILMEEKVKILNISKLLTKEKEEFLKKGWRDSVKNK
jgi:hypothetical protein